MSYFLTFVAAVISKTHVFSVNVEIQNYCQTYRCIVSNTQLLSDIEMYCLKYTIIVSNPHLLAKYIHMGWIQVNRWKDII